MIVEQLIFNILAFALFVIIFYKMISNNDTSYVGLLIIQAIGILINFMEVLLGIKIHFLFKIIAYVFSIILPILIIILEKQSLRLMEIINLGKAKFFLALDQEKLAKSALIKLATKYPNSYYAHKLLAEIYEKEGGIRKAIDEYVQVIDIRKNDYDSYYKIADLLNQSSKKQEASEMLYNLLDKKPEYKQATILLGEILIDQEKYKEAVSIYTEALKLDPSNYEMLYNLGIAYTMLNDFQNAKIYYERASDVNTLLYNAKYSLAEIALIYKELEEAERYFLQAIEDEELEADAYLELAKISLIKREQEKAIQYANIALESEPKKISKKIKNDPVFIPIMAKISIPFNVEENEEENENTKTKKLKQKELKAKEHLEKMVEITKNLGYNDINVLNQSGSKKKTGKQSQKEIEEQNEKERFN